MEEDDYEFENPEDDLGLRPETELPKLTNSRNWRQVVCAYGREARTTFLTQRTVDRALPADKEYTIYHKTLTGFGVRIRPTGHKSFVLHYRKPDGKSAKQSIGNASVMPVSEAEEKIREMLYNLREHGFPEVEKPNHTHQTLSTVFEEYMEDWGRQLSPSWRKQTQQIFNREIKLRLGKQPMTIITKRDLFQCINAGSSIHIKRHIRAVLSAFYSWCVDMEYAEGNPVKELRALGQAKARERILTDHELSVAWQVSFTLAEPYGPFARFLLLSGQRRGEVANMQWCEIDFEQKLWTLPANRTKNKHQHTIPLTKQMLLILEGLPRGSEYVFESPRIEGQPISAFSKFAKNWRQGPSTAASWHIHDVRRTLASGMAMLGIPPHVIEAVIGHRTGVVSGVAAVYNHYKYETEKRDALERWEAHHMAVVEKYKDCPLEDDSDEEEVVL